MRNSHGDREYVECNRCGEEYCLFDGHFCVGYDLTSNLDRNINLMELQDGSSWE